MEPTSFSLMFPTRVQSVEEKKHNNWIRGFGKDAIFEEVSLGWFVCLTGSHEAMFAGTKKPPIEPGDFAGVRITFTGKSPQVGKW